MTQGMSIHIGLNHVDPTKYGGWPGTLNGCINDANAMSGIARSCGYNPNTVLLDEQATAANVLRAIGKAAQTLQSGDILLLTYSGHGGQVADTNGDEEDHLDETWVLYDRMVIDDELYLVWSQFAAGVRIFVLSDSCHSGTAIKQMIVPNIPFNANWASRDGDGLTLFKLIPQQNADANYKIYKDQYDSIQWTAARGKDASLACSVLLISGCQDNQVSGDTPRNGLFTAALLEVRSSGGFRGNYRAFHRQIVQKMPVSQAPNYFVAGAPNAAFEAQKPFTINGNLPIMLPQIAPSVYWDPGDPPIFQVSPGTNPYYAVEVATEPSLFDWAQRGNERRADNFYASWQEVSLFRDTTYALPSNVWQLLNTSNSLYYRVLTSSASDRWINLTASTPDEHADTAPYLSLEREMFAA